MEQIKVTLETLYDLLRNEKKREDLQKLEETFFLDVVSYLREKRALLSLKKDEKQIFSIGEKDKLESELRNIQRILKELYEKREKKIIDIALNRSKTGSDIIDTSSMLIEEKQFYQRVLGILDAFRKGILLQLFQADLPSLDLSSANSFETNMGRSMERNLERNIEDRKQQIKAELDQSTLDREDGDDTDKEKSKLYPVEEKKESKSAEKKEAIKEVVMEKTVTEEKKGPVVNSLTKVKFIRPMPSFVWKDMKVYGPFDTGEETEIFPEVADLLVRKGRAEKV